MAISRVGGTSASSTNGGDATLTLTNITGLAQDDLVIVAYAIGDNDNLDFNMAMVSAGWNEIADIANTGQTQDINLGVFYKFMGASPDTTAVVDGLGGTDAAVAAVAAAYRGVDTATPFDVASTTATGNGSFNPDPPSIDHLNPSGLWTVIAIASGHLVGGTGTYTWPTGYTTTPVQQGANDTSDVTVGIGHRTNPADPENPGAATHSGTSAGTYSWAAVTMALRPSIAVKKTHTADAVLTNSKQEAFRFRDHANASVAINDTNWGVAQNTNITINPGRRFRLRTQVAATATNNTAYKLQYQINAGAWADVGVNSPGQRSLATAVAAVEIVANSAYADAAATTDLLTGGTGSFVAGQGKDTGITTGTINLTGQHTELEWTLWANRWNAAGDTAFVSHNDTIQFRVVESTGTLLNDYVVVPSVTVSIPTGYAGGQFIENPAGVGPFKSSTGNLYFLSEPYEFNPAFTMWKSSDGGDTWGPIDQANNPVANDLEGVSIRQVSNILHIAHWGDIAGVDGIAYHRFNMGADTWDEIDTVVDNNGGAGLSRRDQAISMEVLSSGTVVVLYEYDLSPNCKIGMRRKVSGTWDTTTTIIWNSTDGDWTGVTSVIDTATDIVYAFGKDKTSGDLFGKAILTNGTRQNLFADTETGDGTLIDADTDTSTNAEMNYVRPIYWNDGSPRVFIAWRDPTSFRLEGCRVTVGSGGSVGSVVNVTPSGQQVPLNAATSRQPGASIAPGSGTDDLVCFYAHTDSLEWGDSELYYVTSSDGGATWSGSGTVASTRSWGSQTKYVSANKFTHSAGNGGQTVAGFVFYDANEYNEDDAITAQGGGHWGGYIWYDELALATPPVTKTHTSDAVLLGTIARTHTSDAVLKATVTRTHTSDAALRATVTKVHTSDASLKGTSTRTHTSDAVLRSTVAKTHTSDAVLKATTAKVHTSDATLLATVTKVHTSDASLKGTSTRPHTSDAVLVATVTRTHTSDAVLLTRPLRTQTTDAILLGTSVSAHTADGLLVARLSLLQTSDAVLRATAVRSHSTDAALVLRPSLVQTGDAVLRATVTKIHTTDVLLVARLLQTQTTDAILRSTNIRTQTTDATLQATIVQIHSTDAVLRATALRAHTTDAIFIATLSLIHTTDAVLLDVVVVAHTTDATVRATTAQTHTADALLLATVTRIHTSDAVLSTPGVETKAHTTDASLKGTGVGTHTSDAVLRATTTTIHATDAVLLATVLRTHTSDAVLRATTTVAHQTDASLRGVGVRAHTTDAVTSGILLGTHTTDAILRGTALRTHTTDALLVARIAVSATSDALLVARIGIAHTTDALLRATVARTHTTDAVLRATVSLVQTTDAILRGTAEAGHTTDALLRGSVIQAHSTDALLLGAGQVVHTTDGILLTRIELTHTTDAALAGQLVHTSDAVLLGPGTLLHSVDARLYVPPTHVIPVTSTPRLRAVSSTHARAVSSTGYPRQTSSVREGRNIG